MDDDSGTARTADQPRTPNPDLKRLDTLVGTWVMSGEVHETVTDEWMDGGFFLIQHVNLEQQDGQQAKGMEMIGHLHRFGRGYVRIFTPATAPVRAKRSTTGTHWKGIR